MQSQITISTTGSTTWQQNTGNVAAHTWCSWPVLSPEAPAVQHVLYDLMQMLSVDSPQGSASNACLLERAGKSDERRLSFLQRVFHLDLIFRSAVCTGWCACFVWCGSSVKIPCLLWNNTPHVHMLWNIKLCRTINTWACLLFTLQWPRNSFMSLNINLGFHLYEQSRLTDVQMYGCRSQRSKPEMSMDKEKGEGTK